MDAGKRVVAFEDEDAKRFQYTYDALGRLREVVLPLWYLESLRQFLAASGAV